MNSAYSLAILAAILLVYALVSKRLASTFLTGPLLFVAFGLLMGSKVLGIIQMESDPRMVDILLEATLVLVLFGDAMAINAKAWRKEAYIPERLLGIGLPLTIALGFVAALLLFKEFDIWEAALVGAILAPTDAALGQAVISNPRVPQSVRHGLNVESGLNDGIVFPLVMLLLAATLEAEGASTTGNALWFIVKTIAISTLVGIAVGWVGGKLTVYCDRRSWLDSIWRQIAVLALAGLAYGLVTPFGGSGFISAWVAGFTFGLVVRDRLADISEFPDALGQLLVMISFFVFGNAILGPALGDMTWEVVLYAALSLTVVRIVPVAVSMVRSGTKWPTVLYMGWFGPRGLASIVFAVIIIEEGDLLHVPLIIAIMAATVGMSVLAHGVTAWWGSNRYADWYEGKSGEHHLMTESRPVTGFVQRRRIQT
jgi:sodium/hydrogen antiporter